MLVQRLIPLLSVCLITGCISVQGRVEVVEPGAGHDVLRHIVLVKFREGVTPAQMRDVEEAARKLPGAIPQIRQFEWGLEMSNRNLNKGFSHGMVFTFDSEAARDAYRDHPAHKAFAAGMEPYVDEIFVFDYWVQD